VRRLSHRFVPWPACLMQLVQFTARGIYRGATHFVWGGGGDLRAPGGGAGLTVSGFGGLHSSDIDQ
jgi:hypothetical protein